MSAHGVPELILVEVSKAKRPISYANAFLQPVEGGTDSNIMTKSAEALCEYLETVAKAFAPSDVRRVLLSVGPASIKLESAVPADSLDGLVNTVVKLLNNGRTPNEQQL